MKTMIPKRKVVIIGTGLVGSSCAFSFVHQGLGDELVLIDLNHERAIGEALDLQHALPYLPKRIVVRAGTYADCADANIVVIAAGAPPKPGETRLDSLQLSAKICQAIVPAVMDSGFNGHFVVISNPVDIIAYYVWKLSGLPKNQVVGTGTAIDSARLQTLLGAHLGVNPKSVCASVLGEHGDSQIVAWSQVQIANQPLDSWLANNQQTLTLAERDLMQSATAKAGWEVFVRKGTTYYRIAAAANQLIRAILHDEKIILPVSTLVSGEYGCDDLFLGTPALLGANGVEAVYEVPLTAKEDAQLQQSIAVLQQAKALLPATSN